MDRREQIERLLIGSVLANGEYLRDLRSVSRDDIQDLISRDIFDMLPDLVQRAGQRAPIDILIEDANGEATALVVQAIELTGACDFDMEKFWFNFDAWADYYFGGAPYRPTEVEFKDYVSRFLQLTYATT